MLCRRLGITSMTLWRWRTDPKLGFPKSTRIRERVYFNLAEIEDRQKRQQAAQP
jgi:predicted DNA-binding transcriptional regulator AlpA